MSCLESCLCKLFCVAFNFSQSQRDASTLFEHQINLGITTATKMARTCKDHHTKAQLKEIISVL